MNFEEFVAYVEEHILDYRPELKGKVRVNLSKYVKNNGKPVTALSLFEGESNISPTIRLEDHFEDYNSGKSIVECIEDMLDIYEEYKVGDFDISYYVEDYENARPHIIAKLISRERNEELLKTTPHYIFGDLAVTFMICVRDSFGRGGISVNDSLLEEWKIDVEELLNTAFVNMQENDSVVIFPFDPITIMKSREERFGSGIPDIEEGYPYILSSVEGIFGAASLLRLDILQSFADKAGHNIYVLPLSVDECLLIQDDGTSEVSRLREVLKDINMEVNPQEYVLSNRVYYYDRKRHQLRDSSQNYPMVLMKAGESYEAV